MLNLIRVSRLSTTVGIFNTTRAFSTSPIAFKIGKQQEDVLRSLGYEPPPKAPGTGYIQYAKEYFARNKSSLAGSDGKIDVTNANAQIRQKWDTLGSGEKAKYDNVYKRERQQYETDFQNYLSQYKLADIHKIESVIGKLRIPGGRKGNVGQQVKRKSSGYILFCGDLRTSGAVKIDEIASGKEKIAAFGREAGKRWKALSDAQRESWNTRAKAA